MKLPLLTAVSLFTSILFTQPAPPPAGGNGNSGAPIDEYFNWGLLIAFAIFALYKALNFYIYKKASPHESEELSDPTRR